jgi:hypothetical protein
MKDKVSDYLRVFYGTPDDLRREILFHRPIGINDLDAVNDWVLSTPKELGLLLSRKDDPSKESLEKVRSKWILNRLVELSLLRVTGEGEYVYEVDGETSTRKAFFTELKKEFEESEAAKANSKLKFDLADALSRSADPRGGVEAKIRNQTPGLGQTAAELFPTLHRTRRGINEDVEQTAIGWAKGLSTTQLADMLIRHGNEGPKPAVKPASVAGTSAPTSASVSVTSVSIGKTKLHCVLPADIPKDVESVIRSHIGKARAAAESATGKKYLFEMREVEE